MGWNGSVDGTSGIAIAFRDPMSMDVPPAETTPGIHGSATVAGAPAQLALSTYDASAERVFAMRLDELRAYADVILDQPVGSSGSGWSWEAFSRFVGSLLAGNDLATAAADSSATLTSTAPEPATPRIENRLIVTRDFELGGSLELKNSLLVVDGDLTTKAGQNTLIEGVVYVVGDARLDKGTTEIKGSLIVRGDLRLGTGFVNTASVQYDVQRIEKLRRTVGKYRARRGRSGE